MKHKILYIKNSSSKFNLNTYNVQAIGLGKAFCQLGFDYDFMFFSKKNSLVKEKRINGHTFRILEKKGIRFFRSEYCRSVLNNRFLSNYDIVISTEYGQIMTYCLSRVAKNIVMYSGPYYNLFKFPFVSPIYDLFFNKSINKNCKAKFVKSSLAKKYLEEKGFNNLYNIGVGLDTERFDENTCINDETKTIQLFMQNNPCLLYVGSLSKRKNFPFLLKVYQQVVRIHPEIKLVIIGKGNDHFVNRCLKHIDESARNGILRVQSVDNPQLKFLYPLAKAFLLPSKQEIFGMVILESMYLGAPVITSNNGGSSTLIEGQNTGIIIHDFEVNHWVDAIEKILTDSVDTKEMISLAHDLVKTKYSWLNLAKEMLETVGLSYE